MSVSILSKQPIARPEEIKGVIWEIRRDGVLVSGGNDNTLVGYAWFDNGGLENYFVTSPGSDFNIPLIVITDIQDASGAQKYSGGAYTFAQTGEPEPKNPAEFKNWAQGKVGTGGSSIKIVETFSAF